MTKMIRQSLVKFDAPLCETIIDTPKPQGREVLVRIERCGLCHSDLHIQDGWADLGGGKRFDTTRGMTLPFTLGHEIAGIVDEVGPEGDQSLVGKKKAVFPWIGCGKCRDCLAGDENLCTRNRFLGVAIDGGFATHVLVPDEKYLLDYDPLPTNVAATLMCSGITAYGALKRLVDRPRQHNLLLVGLGGVGMAGLSLAQAMFKQPISVADLNPAAREAALKNGMEKREEFSQILEEHVNDIRTVYAGGENAEGEPYPEPYPGAWTEYATAIRAVVGEGLATGPDNIEFYDAAGGHMLLNRMFYNAVAGKD